MGKRVIGPYKRMDRSETRTLMIRKNDRYERMIAADDHRQHHKDRICNSSISNLNRILYSQFPSAHIYVLQIRCADVQFLVLLECQNTPELNLCTNIC